MKKLINMLNSYPGVNLNERDFIFSKPVYIPHLKFDLINVKSKLKSNGYINKDFLYKRYDLTFLSTENNYEVNVSSEKTVHQLLYKINKVTKFPYQEGNPLSVQDKYALLEPNDVIDKLLPDNSNGKIIIEAKKDSYYFRGNLEITLNRVTNHQSITDLGFFYSLMKK